ncbi:hypothetical protein GNI_142000 [Gregarina niphandrodes]|uniref:C2H2-type domain-containing protein n=1 Tax=Gregarina niphandrodes TaxID=110365 RepID=A0A023B068_GRENI|nr:hypothetical protein GNI_142000 [Gregarina niphandrodes]EZG44980.1 hypothetical protein GNI_142000 [Gregarina niphandrodes]|eukprot:XP_011132606.1 hypothetical protein GNI_142000 [Gregarina niphandrodes]
MQTRAVDLTRVAPRRRQARRDHDHQRGNPGRQERGSERGEDVGGRQDAGGRDGSHDHGGDQQHRDHGRGRGGGGRVPVAPPQSFESEVRALIPAEGGVSKECQFCFHDHMGCTAVTQCTHTGTWCWVCQLKLARLHDAADKKKGHTTEPKCRHCQETLAQVFLSRTLLSCMELGSGEALPRVSEAHAFCCDSLVLQAVKEATEWRCWVPGCNRLLLRTEGAWRSHLYSKHKKKICETCFQAKKNEAWPFQHRLYDPADLNRHRKYGDEQGIPHVRCPACGLWCFDEEAFFNHWTKSNDHVDCQFCQRQGKTDSVFASFEALQKHYLDQHYVCPECTEESLTVFGDHLSLVRHQAVAHARHSRSKAVMSLDQLREEVPEPAVAATGLNHSPLMDWGMATRLWPVPMIATSDLILNRLREAGQRDGGQRETSQTSERTRVAVYDDLFNTGLNALCGRPLADEFRTTSLAYLQGTGGTANQLLSELAHLVWTGYWQFSAAWQSAHAIADITTSLGEVQNQVRENIWADQKLGENRDKYWIKILDTKNGKQFVTNHSIPCEMVVYFIIHIPDQYSSQRLALVDALVDVAKHAADAKKKLTFKENRPAVQPLAEQEEEEQEEEEPDAAPRDANGYRERAILRTCKTLPVSSNLPFVTAALWAIKEFLTRCGHNAVSSRCASGAGVGGAASELEAAGSSPGGPEFRALPLKLATAMSATRTKLELENCSKIAQDLTDLVAGPDLEAFMALRPRYAALRNQEPLADSSVAGGNARPGGQPVSNARPHTRTGPRSMRDFWTLQARLSQKWGGIVEQTLRKVPVQSVWLLKEYCRVSEQLVPHAIGWIPELVVGVPDKVLSSPTGSRAGLEPATSPEPIARGPPPRLDGPPLGSATGGLVGYNTWTHTTFRPSATEEDYPSLPEGPPPGLASPSPPPPRRTGISMGPSRTAAAQPRGGGVAGTRTGVPATSRPDWPNRHTYAAEQDCPRCGLSVDFDIEVCPACRTRLVFTTAQRAEVLNSDYPSLPTQPPPALNHNWRQGPRNGAQRLANTFTGRSGPPKRF